MGRHVTFSGVWGRFSRPIELTSPTKGLYGVFGRAAAAFGAPCQRNHAQGGADPALSPRPNIRGRSYRLQDLEKLLE